MQVNLKQSEIITALKMFVSSQGISLGNKDVTISFTAGRKESGISADISIEDIVIPFDDASDDQSVAQAQTTEAAQETMPYAAAPKAQDKAAKESAANEEVPDLKKTVSLFG